MFSYVNMWAVLPVGSIFSFLILDTFLNDHAFLDREIFDFSVTSNRSCRFFNVTPQSPVNVNIAISAEEASARHFSSLTMIKHFLWDIGLRTKRESFS